MTKHMLQNWRDGIIGVVGFFATITLERWSVLASAVAGTFTSLYMGHKLWKEVVKPWIKKKGR